jgi:hypothetical protein
MNPLNTLAIEAIDFQKDDTGIKLELIVEEIRKELTSGAYKPQTYGNSPTVWKLIKLLKDRFGIKAKIVCNSTGAAVLPVYVNKNHVFLPDEWKGNININEQNKIIAELATKKGYVDNKTAKLGGAFTEATVYFCFDFMLFLQNYKITNAEMTAIILHEIGHAFYAFEYSDRLSSVNQIIAATLQDIVKDKARGNQAYIYKELKKLDDTVTEEDIEAITGNEKFIPGLRFARVYLNSVKSQMNSAKYDSVAFEALADNFVARFGYQEALVTSLLKDHGELSPETNLETYNHQRYIGSAIEISVVLGLLTSVMMPGFSMIWKVLVLIALSILFASSNTNNRTMVYDELKARYKRIRNQMVEQIKQQPMDREDTRALVDSIHRVDAIILKTNAPYYVLTKIMDLIWPSSGKARNSIVEQRLMEELISNDLFVRAAELKNLS